MQISTMEISMSLNGNLGLSWGITQPTEKLECPISVQMTSNKKSIDSAE